MPAGASAAAAEPAEPSKDFSSLIQSEVEDVKSKGKPKLVQYHNTNVGGIMFFILAKEAGASCTWCLLVLASQHTHHPAWHAGCTPAELLTCMAEDIEKTQQNRCRCDSST